MNAATAIFTTLATTGAASARIVGEERSAWHSYRAGDRSPGEDKIDDWLAAAKANGHPLRLVRNPPPLGVACERVPA